MKNIPALWLLLLTAFFISCKSQKSATKDPSDLEGMQHVTLDTMMVEADDDLYDQNVSSIYQAAEERTWDITHTMLDLSFDWKNETVLGKAELTITPVYYPQDTLRLDAVNFKVSRITIDKQPITGFQNNGKEIIIAFPSKIKKGQVLKVEINYTAHPSPSGEEISFAITSDKGLFFIDPQDTIPGTPTQLWTQGETTNNSRWFPTLDQPNERFTQEIIMTVADTMMTLSNGLMISSTPLAGGMRRDHWKLDLPHAPYLAMVAVGQWDKETDYWRGRPVEYYVDKGYGRSARSIFSNTPEMIDFFSKKLDYEFVWPKYAQVIVKDFVSGAMENTTAVVFGDFIQFDKNEIIEEGMNDYIVAHELFHHWFGDLVTCESWANLTLNEGFANYAEYLWQEYKYGRERADIARINELSGYFDQTSYETHPLIHYHYASEEAMFDAHSYNKGGLVLHMLRDLVGDEAFFASLNNYLKEHAFKATEVDDLRQAFEETTGKDLHWFFDQWYLSKGHPVLNISHEYDASDNELTFTIEQTQKAQGYREIFRLPVEIAVIQQDSSIVYRNVMMDSVKQEFTFPFTEEPLAVVMDPKDILLAVVNHDIPEKEYGIRTLSNLSINHRISAFRLIENAEEPLLDKLMRDSSYTMRVMAISYLAEKEDFAKLSSMTGWETNPVLQFYLMETLAADTALAKQLAVHLLDTTDKVPIMYSALKVLAATDVDEAIHWLAHVKDHSPPAIYAVKADIYARKGNMLTLDFFTSDTAARISDGYLEDFIGTMAYFMSGESAAVQDKGLAIIDSDFFLQTEYPAYRRFYLVTGLLKQYMVEGSGPYQTKLLNTVKSLYSKETDEYLRGVLKEGLGELVD
ncbi:MAG TPA: M1 family aminopeptidase [Saprospiraceae bacterium]